MPMFGIRKTFLRAVLTMVGTIIGAGIFGVPSVISEIGIFAGSVLFWVTFLVVLATHLLYLDLIVGVEDEHERKKSDAKRHRYPGYVAAALGRYGKHAAVAIQSLGLIGANFTYLILGGEFLALLLIPVVPAGDPRMMQVLFWAVGAAAILLTLRVMSKVQSAFTWVLILILGFFIASAAAHADVSRFWGSNGGDLLAPVGIFLFSLFGSTIIPELFEITGRRRERTRRAVIWGTGIAALFTWLFGIAVAAAIPAGVAPDRAAMAALVNEGFWWALPLLGLFAVLTSFVAAAFDLRLMYRIDLRQPRIIAEFVALGVPLAMLFVAPTDFLRALDVVGTFFSGGGAFLTVIAAGVFMHRERKKRRSLWWRAAVPVAVSSFFVLIMLDRLVRLAAA